MLKLAKYIEHEFDRNTIFFSQAYSRAEASLNFIYYIYRIFPDFLRVLKKLVTVNFRIVSVTVFLVHKNSQKNYSLSVMGLPILLL